MHVGRYCCTMVTHLSDLEFKVMGSYILIDLVAKHKSGELRCPVTALIINLANHVPGAQTGSALGESSSDL